MDWRVTIEFTWIVKTRERLPEIEKFEDRNGTKYTGRVSTMRQINGRMGESLGWSTSLLRSTRWEAYQRARLCYEKEEILSAKRRAEQGEATRKRAVEHEARLKEVEQGRRKKEEEKDRRREAHEANIKRQAEDKAEEKRLQQERHGRRFGDSRARATQVKTELVSLGVGNGGSRTARKTATNWSSTASHNAKRRRTEGGRYM